MKPLCRRRGSDRGLAEFEPDLAAKQGKQNQQCRSSSNALRADPAGGLERLAGGADSGERARALFRLGELYDPIKEPKKAIAAFREALELEDNPRIAKRYQELADANAFQIKGVEVESDSAQPKFCLNFSDDLAKGRQIHYEDYLVISRLSSRWSAPEGAAVMRGRRAPRPELCHQGPGWHPLRDRRENPRQLRISPPRLRIANRRWASGARYVLPKTSNQQLPLISVNLEQARLRVLRINDRNLLREIENRRITNLLDGYDLNGSPRIRRTGLGRRPDSGQRRAQSGSDYRFSDQRNSARPATGHLHRRRRTRSIRRPGQATRIGPRNGWWFPTWACSPCAATTVCMCSPARWHGANRWPAWNCGCTPATMANWARRH
jgi:tetratricopeptide (TPR) repeat protein